MIIEFETLKEDKQSIKIISVDKKTGERHEIGRIFTPAGSGNDIKNAIQVCGFSEAFDLWGCANYAEPKIKVDYTYDKDKNGNKKFQQCKDIQLQFNSETKQHREEMDWDKDCVRCYNIPCNCDNKQRFANPFTVKRNQDLCIDRKEGKKGVVTIEGGRVGY